MKKSEFIECLSEKAGLSKRDSEVALESVLEVIAEALQNNQSVSFLGFGSFDVVMRGAREVRIPGTDALITVPERKSVRFKPGKGLKEKVR